MLKIFLLIIVIILQSCSPCIVDIYYPASASQRYKAAIKSGESKCYYTVTECDYGCPSQFINRKYYAHWAKKYTDLGLKPPHPKRKDKQGLHVNIY